MEELDSSSPQVPQDIELKDQDKEKEKLLEVVLSDLMSKCYQSPLLKKVKNKSQALLILLSQED
jgi:hypothetical protein